MLWKKIVLTTLLKKGWGQPDLRRGKLYYCEGNALILSYTAHKRYILPGEDGPKGNMGQSMLNFIGR